MEGEAMLSKWFQLVLGYYASYGAANVLIECCATERLLRAQGKLMIEGFSRSLRLRPRLPFARVHQSAAIRPILQICIAFHLYWRLQQNISPSVMLPD